MKLGYDLTIEQTQKLTMTPELIQAIQILQFNTQELDSFVQDELMQNPVLEYDSMEGKKDIEVSKTEAMDKKEAEEYVDFVTGKAAQTVIADSLDRRSVRKDVEAAAYLPDKEEIHMITADEALVNEKKEQWQNRFVDIFREVSGK